MWHDHKSEINSLSLFISQPEVRLRKNRTPFNHGGEAMYARVTLVQILPGKFDQAIDIFRDSVVPVASQQNGHKGHYLLTDRESGKAISISLWETEADRMAGETSGHYLQQLAKFKDIFAAPPLREDYEISVQP
jgi:heme-degrading monooxygenase HmoA